MGAGVPSRPGDPPVPPPLRCPPRLPPCAAQGRHLPAGAALPGGPGRSPGPVLPRGWWGGGLTPESLPSQLLERREVREETSRGALGGKPPPWH